MAPPRAPKGMRLLATLRQKQGVVLRLSWSKDGKLLVAASVDKSIHVWDWEKKKEIVKLDGHGMGVNQAEWSPNGAELASGSADGTIRVWDTTTWKTRNLFREHGDVRCVVWSPDGRLLLSGSTKRSLTIRDAASGRVIETLPHSDAIDSLVWSPDGQFLASCCRDGVLNVLRSRNWTTETEIHVHSRPVLNAAWSPDGSHLASASEDSTVAVTPLDGGESTILREHSKTVRSVSYSPNGNLLASNSRDGSVLLWRTDNWSAVAELDESTSDFWPPTIAFHPRRPILATLGERDTIVRIWDVRDLVEDGGDEDRRPAITVQPRRIDPPPTEVNVRAPVFISYSHKDNEDPDPAERWLDRLLEFLAPLRSQNQVCAWSDRELQIGDDWQARIQASLSTARAAVLLVSPAFTASEFVMKNELPVLLRRARENGMVILPINIRTSLFHQMRLKYPDPLLGPEEVLLSAIQAANSPKKPLNSLLQHQQDAVFADVASRLLAIIES